MSKNKKSLKNFIIFWVIALLTLFGWYFYLAGNNLYLLIALSLIVGAVLGTLVYPVTEFLSEGKNDLKDATIKRTDIRQPVGQLNESLEQAIKKTEPDEPSVAEFSNVEIKKGIWQNATPEEVKKRLSQLLRDN